MSELKGKVYVYTVPRPSATKITEVTNMNGKKLNQTKISKGIGNKFQVGISARTGRLNTGLDVDIENPYKEDKPESMPNGFASLAGKDKIKLQHLKEIEWKLPFDYLTSEPFNRDALKAGKEPTFYQTFSFVCNDGLTIFDRTKMHDDLAYYAMQASKRFANSKKELDDNKWPDAIHYIGHEDEDEQLKYRKNEVRVKALAALGREDIASPEMHRKLIKVLLPKQSKGTINDRMAFNILTEAIENDKQLRTGKTFAEEFLSKVNSFDNAHGREHFEAEVKLRDYLNNWIIQEKQGTYYWPAGDITIAHSYKDAVLFLQDPEKQGYVEQLDTALKTKLAFVNN